MNIRFTISDDKFRPYCSLLDSGVNAYMSVPLPDYDKTYYLYEEKLQKLTACKVLKVVIGSLNTFTRPFLWLETPDGKREIDYRSAILLESKEHFLRYMQGKAVKYNFEEKRMKELFPNELIHTYKDLLFFPSTKRCWVFKNGRAEKDSVTMHYLTFDKNGCEVCFFSSTDDKRKVYLSQEDCLKDNMIDVVDFDEVENATSHDLMDATNNHDPQLVECINKAWNDPAKRKDFITIVNCLAKRDIDEFINPEFYAMQDDKKRCHEYCQHIADDKDLDTILCYCRM